MSAREELFRRVAGAFVSEDRANKLIDDVIAEAAPEVAALRASLEEMTRCRDNALRALYRDDVETDVDLEETIAAPFYGPGWDWDEADLMRVVREAVAAVRPPFAKLTEERDGLREERHSTNEALDDVVRELQMLRAQIAELETERDAVMAALEPRWELPPATQVRVREALTTARPQPPEPALGGTDAR